MRERGNKKQENLDKIKRELLAKKSRAETAGVQASQPLAESNDVRKQQSTGAPTKDEVSCITKADMVSLVSTLSVEAEGETQIERSILAGEAAEPDMATSKTADFVSFLVGSEEFAFEVLNISEIIRVPHVVPVPGSPGYLLGINDWRGESLPVIDARILLGMQGGAMDDSARVIVTESLGARFGLLTNRVTGILHLKEEETQTPPANLMGLKGGFIKGIAVLDQGRRTVILLDVARLVPAARSECQPRGLDGGSLAAEGTVHRDDQIVIFKCDSTEYAFHIEHVKEIIGKPRVVSAANSTDSVEGMFSLRNELVPLINLAKLLGSKDNETREYSRVMIIDDGAGLYGFGVDSVSDIATVTDVSGATSADQPNGEHFVKEIIALGDGQRMVVLLDPVHIIGYLQSSADGQPQNTAQMQHSAASGQDKDVLIFEFEAQEYAIDIAYVREIARAEEWFHLPEAPHSTVGFCNLRGEIIPILSLGRLFGAQDSKTKPSKFIVLERGDRLLGLQVDTAKEVFRVGADMAGPMPDAYLQDHDNLVEEAIKRDGAGNVILRLKADALFQAC